MNFVQSLAGKNCLVIGAGVTGMACQEALVNFAVSYTHLTLPTNREV